MIEYIKTDIPQTYHIQRVIEPNNYNIDKSQYFGYFPIFGITILYVKKLGNNDNVNSLFELKIIKSDTINDSYYFNDISVKKIITFPNDVFIYHGITVNYYFFEYNSISCKNLQYNIEEDNTPKTIEEKPIKKVKHEKMSNKDYVNSLQYINDNLTKIDLTTIHNDIEYSPFNAISIYHYDTNIKLSRCKLPKIQYCYYNPRYKITNNLIIVKVRYSKSRPSKYVIFIYKDLSIKCKLFLPEVISNELNNITYNKLLFKVILSKKFFYANSKTIKLYEYSGLDLDNVMSYDIELYHSKKINPDKYIFNQQYKSVEYNQYPNDIEMIPRITIIEITKYKNKYFIILLKTPFVQDHLYFPKYFVKQLKSDLFSNSEITLLTNDSFLEYNNIYKYQKFTYNWNIAKTAYNIKKALNYNVPILNAQNINKKKGNKIYKTKYYNLCSNCNIELINISRNNSCCKKCQELNKVQCPYCISKKHYILPKSYLTHISRMHKNVKYIIDVNYLPNKT